MSEPALAERLRQWAGIAGLMRQEGSSIADDLTAAATALDQCHAVLEEHEYTAVGDVCHECAELCGNAHAQDCAWAQAMEATR